MAALADIGFSGHLNFEVRRLVCPNLCRPMQSIYQVGSELRAARKWRRSGRTLRSSRMWRHDGY